ncbi:MAG: hypothetical protein K5685_01790 [Bacteroidales bacterium]|nr:hypothetical protein [Bacteroidales bacterium]
MKKSILTIAMIIATALTMLAQSSVSVKKFQNEGKNNLYRGTQKNTIVEGDLNKDGIIYSSN